jgi:tRNA1(Val) A37 N6-methylase TrmN6
MTDNVTEDWLLNGKMHLKQPANGHRAGTDAILLAAAAASLAKGDVADFGAGSGVAGLALAVLKPDIASLALAEIDDGLCALARENTAQLLPGISAKIAHCDLLAAAKQRVAAGLPERGFHLILSNPPFHPEGKSRPSPSTALMLAHFMAEATIEYWIRATNYHLKPGGWLVMIHRPDALPQLLDSLEGRFGDIGLRPVHSKADAPATRLLVAAKKGSRAPLRMLPSINLHNMDGAVSAFSAALHRGEATIPM